MRAHQTPKQLSFKFMEPEVYFDGRIDNVKVLPYARYTPPTFDDTYREFRLMNAVADEFAWRGIND